jgi:ribonuclease HI
MVGNRRVAYLTSVIEVETKAIIWAIHVALVKGFKNVILKTDSTIIVVAFLHNTLLHVWGLFLHVRRLCCSFTSCSWSFVRRDGNQVAHELARKALHDVVDYVHDDFVSPLLNRRVLNDVICLCK